MSGQLYRFQFADTNSSVSYMLKSGTVTSVEVTLVFVESGETVRQFRLQCDSFITCRESLYGLLRSLDAEFAHRISFFDRDDYRVIVKRLD